MKVRILERSAVTRNLLIFQIFSLVYLYVIQSLSLGTSALEWRPFLDMLEVRPWMIASFILTFFSIYWGTRFSSFFFVSFCLLILGESFLFLLKNFDKLILVLIFFHAICSMYFLLFWKLEQQEAIYCPSFDKNFIGKLSEYNLKVEVESPSGQLRGILTNWDTKGCFFSLSHPHRQLKGKIRFKILFEGFEFQCQGQVVTKYAEGYGIRLIKTPETLNWESFYDIISDRGYRPRYV